MSHHLLPADFDPLDLVACWPERYPAFLDSSAENPLTGALDLLPIADGRHLRLDADGLVRDQDGQVLGDDFARALDQAWAQSRTSLDSYSHDATSYRGGWLLYLGYETVAGFERSLSLPVFTETQLPVALAIRTPAVWLYDRASRTGQGRAEPGHESLLLQLASDAAVVVRHDHQPAAPRVLAVKEDPGDRFIDAVARVLDNLRAGDVFQVNLSRGWQARFDRDADPVALYRRLRRLNPAPFSGILRWQDAAILSASPERLVRVRGRHVETRPIAGTRPRGETLDDDLSLRAELIGHPKERAEHVMLIDLERNDLGRICIPGSIRVDEMMGLESYAHVHHIVSNVSGELRAGVTPGEVLRAVFPGGTITGCPKVRCMEIIAALEGAGRGPYTGAMGFLDVSGNLDMNILIRSAWQQGDRLGFRTGAGIVIDSVPERELAETRVKAGGMLGLIGELS